MNRFIIGILFLLTTPLLHGQSVEEQVLRIEAKRSEAIAAYDTVYLSHLYDDQFHGVTATGRAIDKKALMQILKTTNSHVTFSTDEMRASLYGITVIVTGKLLSKSKSGNLLGQSRFLHVYMKKNEEWKIIQGQATTIIQ